jgi:starch synthase
MNLLHTLSHLFHHLRSITTWPLEFFLHRPAVDKLNPSHIIYMTPFAIAHDGRVMKSVDALLAKGYYVELVKPGNLKDDDVVPWQKNLTITPIGLAGSYSHFPYVFDWKVLSYLRKSLASKIYCRDFFTGIMAVMACQKTIKEVVVDFYEWYSATLDYIDGTSIPKPWWKKKLIQWYEHYLCRHAHRLITNNHSFAKGISQGRIPLEKFTIIRNTPPHYPIDQSLNLRFLLPPHLQEKKILYYVAQLSVYRKLDTLIRGMKFVTDEYILIMQGTGVNHLRQVYREILRDIGEKIVFFPPIHHTQIVSYASSADLGIFVNDVKEIKMYYTLPNKLFEYVFAEIPQVSCQGPEIEAIFEQHPVGLVFDAYDPFSFAKTVQEAFIPSTYQALKKETAIYKNILLQSNDFNKI